VSLVRDFMYHFGLSVARMWLNSSMNNFLLCFDFSILVCQCRIFRVQFVLGQMVLGIFQLFHCSMQLKLVPTLWTENKVVSVLNHEDGSCP
jgi:hypothetical protein